MATAEKMLLIIFNLAMISYLTDTVSFDILLSLSVTVMEGQNYFLASVNARTKKKRLSLPMIRHSFQPSNWRYGGTRWMNAITIKAQRGWLVNQVSQRDNGVSFFILLNQVSYGGITWHCYLLSDKIGAKTRRVWRNVLHSLRTIPEWRKIKW